MKKSAIIIFCLALLGIGLYYFYIDWQEQQGLAKQFATWKEFIPRSGLFKVLLPSSPQYAKDYIAIPNSDQRRRKDVYASEKVDGTLFLVSVITYPTEGEEAFSSKDILRENIDEAIRSQVGNQLTKLASSVLGGHAIVDFGIESQEFKIEGKQIQDGHMVYILTYITQKDHFDPAEYQYFVNSFQLLKKEESQK